MKSFLNQRSAHQCISCFVQSFFLSIFLVILSGLTVDLFAQGSTACSAVSVMPGSYIADGPSSGNGAINGCSFVSNATHADWYKFQPVVDGLMTVGSCNGGADTRLSILTGFCIFLPPFGSSFTSTGCIANSDDACTNSSIGGPNWASVVNNIAVTAGTTYYIQWDNRWSSEGFSWTLDFTPYNDEPCGNDQPINIACGDTLVGSTYGASESGVISGCNGGSGEDVFYMISPLATGATYRVDVIAGDDMDPVLSAYNGSCNGSVILLGCSDFIGDGVDESITFTSEGNNTVWIRVYDYYFGGGNFSITLTCIADECPDAIPLATDGTILNSDNSESTGSSNSFTCASSAANNDIWFKFTTPNSGDITVETHAGTITDTKIQIWDDCPTSGEVIACNDDGGENYLSKVVLRCGSYLPNHTYYVQADSYSSTLVGTFGISVDVDTECEAPANDLCADAIPLLLNAPPTNGNNTGATGSPDISIDCGFFGENAATNDVWYSFVAPATGQVVVEVFSDFLTDSQLQILDGCGGNVIACNEDGGVSLMSKITLDCTNYTPGNTYLVQVDGWQGAQGSFSISVTSGPCPPPANDICADAVALTVHDQGDCSGNQVIGTTSGAISEGLTTACEPDDQDVFYSFNSGDNTSVVVNLDGITATDLVITVIEGSCAGNQILCYGNSSPYTVEVIPNTDYIVRVATNTSYGDPGTFNICVEEGYDCPYLSANIGDACDDGNPATENDVVTADCNCEGTIIYDCPALSANIGDSCNDGDPTTENDVVTADCNCEGTSIYDCPALSANIGDACDDGNPATENDVVNADCNCEGTIIYDCPALSANIGDSCNDGDPATENDVVTADCTCEGTSIYDCPALSANIGDACDDGDPYNLNDVISSDCTCQGTPPNDECNDAVLLNLNAPGECGENSTIGTTTGATPSDVEAGCQLDLTDVFYQFNSGSIYHKVHISLSAITAIKVYMTFFSGGDCTSSAVFCGLVSDDGETFQVNPETSYLIRVQAAPEETGTFNICVEGIYDCPDLGLNYYDSCDDGDPTTDNDMVTADCTCEGTSIYDCPALSANIGDACDDGNSNTVNDVIRNDCTCSGTIVSFGSVSGTIAGWNNSCADRDLVLTLAAIDGGSSYFELPGTLYSDGTFTLDGSPEIAPNTYNILVKVDGALSKRIDGVVINSGSNTIVVSAILLGDINNDDVINISDISQFATGFGSASGDANYNPLSDFNCDGIINIVDVYTIGNKFGQAGDVILP